MEAIRICLFLLLLFTLYQDLRYRGVFWWTFPLLFIGFGMLSCAQDGVLNWSRVLSVNLAFLFLQFFLLTAYFSVRKKRLTNVFSGLIGLGDMLFLLSMSAYLPMLSYAGFYILSLLLVILAYVVINMMRFSVDHRIPLAGYQAAMMGGVLCWEWVSGDSVLYIEHLLAASLGI